MFFGWWGWSSGRGWRGGFGFWGWLVMIGLIWFLSGGRMPGWIFWFLMPMVIFGVLPAVLRALNATSDEKRKRDEFEFNDKPKREPRYVVGDDGELVEALDEKPKHDDRYV